MAEKTMTLGNASNTVNLIANGNVVGANIINKGSATQPIYFDENGIAQVVDGSLGDNHVIGTSEEIEDKISNSEIEDGDVVIITDDFDEGNGSDSIITPASIGAIATRDLLATSEQVDANTVSGKVVDALVIKELKSNFQDGVEQIYNAIVAKGTTPASKDLSDVIAGIGNIPDGTLDLTRPVNISTTKSFSQGGTFRAVSASGSSQTFPVILFEGGKLYKMVSCTIAYTVAQRECYENDTKYTASASGSATLRLLNTSNSAITNLYSKSGYATTTDTVTVDWDTIIANNGGSVKLDYSLSTSYKCPANHYSSAYVALTVNYGEL